MVTYAQGLQFWVDKVNLSTEGKPCLLVGSLIELWEEMKCYLSFSDEDVFKGIGLPEEAPQEVTPQSAQPLPAGTPVKEATMDTTMEPAAEKRPPNQFPGWEKVLHPSRPISAAGQIPPLSRGPRQRPHSQSLGEGLAQIPQTKELRVSTTQSEPPSPTKELGVVQRVMLSPGFAGVTACLWRDQLPAGGFQPRCIEDGSTVRAHCSDHEHQSHC